MDPLLVIAVCLTAVIVAGVGCWQRQRAAASMTLSQALWVTERDYSRYYPPGSPESRSVVEVLARKHASLLDRTFDSFVLYRRGLSDTSPANERLLVIGFIPPTLPAKLRAPTP